MISNLALSNFKAFLDAGGPAAFDSHVRTRPVAGAYDSRGGYRLRDFEPGGRFGALGNDARRARDEDPASNPEFRRLVRDTLKDVGKRGLDKVIADCYLDGGDESEAEKEDREGASTRQTRDDVDRLGVNRQPLSPDPASPASYKTALDEAFAATRTPLTREMRSFAKMFPDAMKIGRA
jgi:hypothetical protein